MRDGVSKLLRMVGEVHAQHGRGDQALSHGRARFQQMGGLNCNQQQQCKPVKSHGKVSPPDVVA
jgi:hypothetical protein